MRKRFIGGLWMAALFLSCQCFVPLPALACCGQLTPTASSAQPAGPASAHSAADAHDCCRLAADTAVYPSPVDLRMAGNAFKTKAMPQSWLASWPAQTPANAVTAHQAQWVAMRERLFVPDRSRQRRIEYGVFLN